MSRKLDFLAVSLWLLGLANAQAQSAPNIYQVLMYSATSSSPQAPYGANIFSENMSNAVIGSKPFGPTIKKAANYGVAQSIAQLSNILNSNIATALSVIPFASPASGTIYRTDSTGADWPVSSTLGGIYTERADTIGKGKWYIGFTHQSFHFTSLDGRSLNGIQILYSGGDASKILKGNQTVPTYPATFDLGLDVRLSQDVAFLTYGVSSRIDVSVGLPLVHAAVAATTYNGMIDVGGGLTKQDGMNCWCVDTFTPGVPPTGGSGLYAPLIGQASLGKTGFGDLLLRVKGTVIDTERAVIAIGTDLRFPTGNEQNYLGTGATSVKPFVALSLYTKRFDNGIVLSPHANIGWQFAGKSVLAGQLQGSSHTVSSTAGPVTYVGAPFTSTKDYLPDVFSWAVGSEVAFGRRMTVVVDILGNQIGWVHGIQNTVESSAPGFSPISFKPIDATGLVSAGRTSIGQYNGAFGYKVRIKGNLVATFNALVRFDNNGLTARFVPLVGLGYTFY
jgi:hypothetical protein